MVIPRFAVLPGAVAPPIPKARRERPPATIVVRRRPGRAGGGLLAFGGAVQGCALGRAGIVHVKREGDGGTPAAAMAFHAGLFRADRGVRPRTPLPVRAARAADGWCDAAFHPLYNRFCRLPLAASHEELARRDGLYDVVVVLDYNIRPRRAGGGSAIFLHCARPADAASPAGTVFAPTAGCVALPKPRLLALLARLPRRARIVVA